MFCLSFVLFDRDGLSTFLFLAGPLAVAMSGAIGRWRGLAVSFVLPVLLVLLFPEHGELAPQDPGGCDPFCSDPVAGVDWAVGLGVTGAVVAAVGWLVAAAVARVRRRRIGGDIADGSQRR
jgi:hypothetical protein